MGESIKMPEQNESVRKAKISQEIEELKLFIKMQAQTTGQVTIHNQVSEFIGQLQQKYNGECNQCELYHEISNSGTNTPTPLYDFTGEDSIAAFVKRKLKEINF